MLKAMIEWKYNSTGLNKKICNCVTLTVLRRKRTGGTEVRWVNTSSKALRGEERDEKRVKKMCTDMKVVEKRWREVRSRWKSWQSICDKRSEVPEKSIEVCPSSYRQTLFLDPIALHFLNLETSATRLARVLRVPWYTIFIVFLLVSH